MIIDRNYRSAALLLGCLCVAFVTFATLSPIELRPRIGGAGLEHFAAFVVIGVLLDVALPRRLLVVAILLAAIAVSLEAAQFLVPGRHGRLIDLGQKLLGAGTGLVIAASVEMLLQRIRGARDTPSAR